MDARKDAPGDPRLKRLLAYWEDKRGGKEMPTRADIDPAGIGKDLLPWVALTEIVDGGARFRFRLCGTGLAELAGLDLTGRYVDELNPSQAYADYIIGLYRTAVMRRRPIYSRTSYAGSSASPQRQTERLICPLGDGLGAVTMCISGQVSGEIGLGIYPTLTYAAAFQPGQIEVL